MNTLALVTQKGGTGKSSLSVSLAVAAEQSGLRTYLLDLDPQGTARKWYERRVAATPELATIEPSQVPTAIGALKRQGYELVIIDTPGVDTPATAAAMQAADLCLVPARPSTADLEATLPTVSTLLRLGKGFAFVLNQCPPNRSIKTSPRTKGAFESLRHLGVVADVAIELRADHQDAMFHGLGVTEFDPSSKAAGEIRALLEWVQTRLERSQHVEKTRVA
jgi:chromosome partitioning protein